LIACGRLVVIVVVVVVIIQGFVSLVCRGSLGCGIGNRDAGSWNRRFDDVWLKGLGLARWRRHNDAGRACVNNHRWRGNRLWLRFRLGRSGVLSNLIRLRIVLVGQIKNLVDLQLIA
jgi:hypothetical protein